MGQILIENEIIEINDPIFWSYQSSLYLIPKFFISFLLTDEVIDDQSSYGNKFEIYIDLRHIELNEFQNVKELFNKPIKLNDQELNKTLNVEVFRKQDLKIISISFELKVQNDQNKLTGQGIFFNLETEKMVEFQFDSDVTIKETKYISKTNNQTNMGFSRMELIRSISDIYNCKGMINLKEKFPNVHRGYEIINEWFICFGTVHQLYQKDYTARELMNIKKLNKLLINFIKMHDMDGLSLPEIPQLYETTGWSKIKDQAFKTLHSIDLKHVHPDFKLVLSNESNTEI